MTINYLSTVWTGICYILYLVFCIILLVLHVLSIIAAPLLHAGQYLIYACCWYPIHVLAKFETLYIFFGVAVLLGALTGTSLHYASAFLTTLFDVDNQHEEPRGRKLSLYRTEKQGSLENGSLPTATQTGLSSIGDVRGKSGWKRSTKGRGSHRNGLIPNTIVEEVDSTDDSF